MSKVRIAFCISGQPRTWRKCVPGWKKFEQRLKEITGAEQVDYFCHAWDFNTPPHVVLANAVDNTGIAETYTSVKGITISQQEKEDLIAEINPVSIKWENESVSKRRSSITWERGTVNANEHGQPVMAWAASQFYGVMQAAELKKTYEYENFFTYDYVFKLRFDLFLDDHQIDWFFNKDSRDFVEPAHNTVYTCHTRKDPAQFPFHRFGDIFWYSDSYSFDKISRFYDWLPCIGSRSFISNDIATEHVLYFYAKMLKMSVRAISIDPKIFRQSNYLELKQQAGFAEGLGGHELI
jgi:hypothetical protein